MRAVDTNVVVRFLVRDDPVQAARAREIVSQGVFLTSTVLLETEWVLRSGYKWDRGRIGAALSNLVAIEQVSVAELEDMKWALDRYEAGADWADMSHLSASRGHIAFATFDKRLLKDAGPATPIAVEVLK